MTAVSERLVSTGEAARRLGVNLRTLQRWASDGLITPDWITPGGHMRWNVDRLLGEIKQLPPPEDQE
jgi:excisionase family DNA binding protein